MNKTIFDYEDAALAQFDLQGFFPYQVRVFYTEVSSAVAEIYQEKQDMSAAEWRCLAILNAGGKMTAADIVLASASEMRPRELPEPPGPGAHGRLSRCRRDRNGVPGPTGER